ncbi:hypothetical protein BG000_002679 [Podila horticola]|nr:hypothetical protein BG003_010748 [Podila horticola]KAG0323289.1 hypothetical protein BG000_002679 [Podila horticola]
MLLSRIHLIEHITRTLLPRTAIALPANRHLATSSTMSHASAQNQCISDPIKKDHRELEEYYHKILNAKDEDEKTRWANQFTWELARHSVGEELIMYPCMKRVLKNGESLVAKDLQQHQEVKEQLYKFQSMKATDPEFEPTLRAMWKDLAQHNKEEEEMDLVELEQTLSTEESADLAKKFHLTKKFVPTRSHPSAPNEPPFETVVGLLTAPIDKLHDIFSRFPKDD